MECLFARGKKITDFASRRAIYVNNCGYWRALEKDISINRPNGRSDYHLIFNASGGLTVNGERICEGEAYIIFPWERQDYTYESRENSIYYWLHFSGTSVDGILKGLSLCGGKYSLLESKGEAEEILRRIIKAVSGEWEGTDEYVAGQLYSLFALLSAPRRNKNPFTKAIKRLCDQKERVSVAELAESYGMSEGHFIRQFKSYTGQTPLEYRVTKRMETAKSLLAGTDLSVTDISSSLGFDDPLYFSRVFKRHTGVSPRDYRNKYI